MRQVLYAVLMLLCTIIGAFVLLMLLAILAMARYG